MLAPVTHILPVTNIQRERMLPVPGRVLARKGQKVNPGDIVAEAIVSPQHLLLDISRGLGLPPEDADRYIKVQAGAQVDAGDVIAGPMGIARRVVRCPKPGKVVVAGSGQVLLELESKPLQLKAGFAGTVTELYPDQGVVLQTTGALIQGVWGNGGIDFGLLSNLAKTPGELLTADRLDVSMRGSVILAGYCADAAVLRAADEIPLRALILASMSADLAPVALRSTCPIILLEGFGKLPMNPVAYKLLTTNDRREVSVNAAVWDSLTSSRPEIIITLPAESPANPKDVVQFKPGQQVRILRAPQRGVIGTLTAILPEPVQLPSGVRAPAAEVRLQDDDKSAKVVIPLANLEVLA